MLRPSKKCNTVYSFPIHLFIKIIFTSYLNLFDNEKLNALPFDNLSLFIKVYWFVDMCRESIKPVFDIGRSNTGNYC